MGRGQAVAGSGREFARHASESCVGAPFRVIGTTVTAPMGYTGVRVAGLGSRWRTLRAGKNFSAGSTIAPPFAANSRTKREVGSRVRRDRACCPLASIRRAVSTRQIAITDDDDLPCCLNNIQGTKNSGRKKKKLRAHRFDLDSAKGCSAQVGQHYTFKMATGITSNLHWR